MKTKIKISLLILCILTLGYCKVKEPDLTFYESVKRKLETPEEKEARRVAENAARDEAAKRSFLEQASCRPKQPLSQGELYALAMQDYWRIRTDRLRTADSRIIKAKKEQEIIDEIPDNINRKICGLKWDKEAKNWRFEKRICYPWKLEEFDTYEKIVTWYEEGNRAENLEELLHEKWHGEIYDPKKGFLHQPDFYHQESSFAVIQRDDNGTRWYPKDCCRLIDDKEAKLKKSEQVVVHDWIIKQFPETRKVLPNLNYLAIKSKLIDYNVRFEKGIEFTPRRNDVEKYFTYIYMVNSCGKIINLKP